MSKKTHQQECDCAKSASLLLLEDQRFSLTSDHHHGHSKDFLSVRRRGDVAEADAGQTGHGEVQGGDVDGLLVWAALPLSGAACVEAVWRAHRLGQHVQPAVRTHDVGLFIDDLIITDAVPGRWTERISSCLWLSCKNGNQVYYLEKSNEILKKNKKQWRSRIYKIYKLNNTLILRVGD